MIYEEIRALVEAAGLCLRGGFNVQPEDDVPELNSGEAPGSVLLVGNVGSDSWPAFSASPEFADGQPHPLDRWSERTIGELARQLGACALFPFKGPPYYPFQRWALRCESLHPSPLGVLIHSEYGVWHAYRGALVFNRKVESLPGAPGGSSPCLSCETQPCLNTCPVDAFTTDGFDASACFRHLRQEAPCMDQGCLARNACPVAKNRQYSAEQHRFHLHAFFRARLADTG